jgi:hypothetical protein
MENTTLTVSLESVWPSKPALRAICVDHNREDSYQALVTVCRAHGVDEDCIRSVVASVLKAK